MFSNGALSVWNISVEWLADPRSNIWLLGEDLCILSDPSQIIFKRGKYSPRKCIVDERKAYVDTKTVVLSVGDKKLMDVQGKKTVIFINTINLFPF